MRLHLSDKILKLRLVVLRGIIQRLLRDLQRLRRLSGLEQEIRQHALVVPQIRIACSQLHHLLLRGDRLTQPVLRIVDVTRQRAQRRQ